MWFLKKDSVHCGTWRLCLNFLFDLHKNHHVTFNKQVIQVIYWWEFTREFSSLFFLLEMRSVYGTAFLFFLLLFIQFQGLYWKQLGLTTLLSHIHFLKVTNCQHLFHYYTWYCFYLKSDIEQKITSLQTTTSEKLENKDDPKGNIWIPSEKGKWTRSP